MPNVERPSQQGCSSAADQADYMSTNRIDVVGCVLVRDDQILCAKRSQAGQLPGLWEFPGGKIEANESPSVALVREIHEELDCTVEVRGLINLATHDYDFVKISLTTFYCILLSGSPTPREHESLTWLPPRDLLLLDWAPADLPAVHQVRLDFGYGK